MALAVGPRDQWYVDMLCLTVVRVTRVPTQVDTLRQAGQNTIGTTTPQTANLNSRVTGVPTQVDAH
jgi:hypothetical protein